MSKTEQRKKYYSAKDLGTPVLSKQFSADDTDRAEFSTESHSAKAGEDVHASQRDGDISGVTPFVPDFSPPGSPETQKTDKATFYMELGKSLAMIDEDSQKSSSSESSQA
jgi:hypothetical protein